MTATAIDAQQVMELRRRTGLGVMECKQALVVASGDVEAAIDELRKAGALKAAKKGGRSATEGLVQLGLSEDGKLGVMVEVNCETDFVARDENFVALARRMLHRAIELRSADVAEVMSGELEQARLEAVQKLGENIALRRIVVLAAPDGHCDSYLHGNQRLGTLVAMTGGDKRLGRDIAMHITASAPQVVAGEDMPEELVNRERAIYMAQAEQSGKSPDIVEKMVAGRLRKFVDEHSLLQQPFVKDPQRKVGELLAVASATVTAFSRFEVGEGLVKTRTNLAEEVAAQLEGH